MGFHDKTRHKSENKKMELAIPLDILHVYLLFSERIIHLPHVYPKLCLIFKLNNGEKGFHSLIRIFLAYLALILHSIKSI